VKTAFATGFPALDPITDVQSALDAKLDIRREQVPNKVFSIYQFETGAFRLQTKAMHSAVGHTSSKVHEEEMVFESWRQSCARDGGHAGGLARYIVNGRHDVGRLAVEWRVPEPLSIERSARIRVFHELVSDAPSIVASFHQVNPPGLVTAIGIVIPGK